jgi:hypothetical protein
LNLEVFDNLALCGQILFPKHQYFACEVITQTFTTHLIFDPVVSVGAPDRNKFLFAKENKLVWPTSLAKLLGKHSLNLKAGDEHK